MISVNSFALYLAPDDRQNDWLNKRESQGGPKGGFSLYTTQQT